VKNQVEGAVNDVKNQVDNAKNTANDLYGNLQSGFKKEGSAGSANNGSVVSGTNEVVPWQFGEGEDFFADTQSGNDGNFVSTSVYNSDIQKKEPENKAVEPVSSKMIEGLWAEDNEVELSAGPVEKTAIEAKTDGPLLLKDEKPVADRVVVPQKELDMDGLKNPINLDLKKSDDLPNLKNIERSEDLKPISAEKNVITPTKFVKPATTPTLTPAAQNLKDKAVSVSAPVSTKPEALSTAPTPAPAPTLSTAVKPALQKTTPSSATITRKAFEKVSYVDVYQHGFAAEAKFATGTDGEANYYFPDTFALWTGINFDDKVDEEKMEKAVSTICSDLNSTDDTTKAAYVNQYNKLLAEAKAHAQAYSAATVKETESTKTTDDLESMNGKLGSMLDQMSGSGEILTAEVEQNKRELVMIADNIQLEVFGELLHYCDIYQVGEKDYANGEKFAVGVDDNGVFHYPERMARWCSLDVKDEKNKDVLEGCLSKICSDMNASNETDANDAKMYYENMMKEVWVNAFILTVEIKQKYANTKLEDKASDITEKAAGERTTQTTGNSEIDKFLKRMKYDAERLREVVFELQAYRVVSDFCDVFIQKEQGEKE
ncbi:MAG TPA: hypothetical protein DIC64_03290, partial [Alphaproteobacteria bacterium]|nr:hypothetical protein [Alphaproteobacteria bacterium]